MFRASIARGWQIFIIRETWFWIIWICASELQIFSSKNCVLVKILANVLHIKKSHVQLSICLCWSRGHALINYMLKLQCHWRFNIYWIIPPFAVSFLMVLFFLPLIFLIDPMALSFSASCRSRDLLVFLIDSMMASFSLSCCTKDNWPFSLTQCCYPFLLVAEAECHWHVYSSNRIELSNNHKMDRRLMDSCTSKIVQKATTWLQGHLIQTSCSGKYRFSLQQSNLSKFKK